MEDYYCEGCGRELTEDNAVQVREIETGLVVTVGADCCCGLEQGYCLV